MEEFYALFNGDRYISHNDAVDIQKEYHALYKRIKANILFFLFKNKRLFIKDFKNINHLVIKANELYIEKSLVKYQHLLDDIKGYPLDHNQRLIVLREEQNTIVIAGAGSGKSLTIIGKIRYLIEEKFIEEKDILAISFTNDSAASLRDSLKSHYNYNVGVFTFHKLALLILKDSDKNIYISPPDTLEFIINEFFDYLIFDHPKLLKVVTEYFNEDYHSLIKKKSFIKFKKLIGQFIHLFKANIYSEDILYSFLYNEGKAKNRCLLICIITLYRLYTDELISSGEIDFDDMIVLATKQLIDGGLNRSYRYIIIDEYQDSSLIRCQLIQEIVKLTNAKLMAVGDDWQSIYRFTGCNLDIFLNFKDYFPNPDILYIYNTYRNNQELIDIAGNFIMRNKRQMQKKLLSTKHIDKPIKVIYYDDLKYTFKKLIEIMNTKVLVLGRNNGDIYKAIDNTYKIDGNVLSYNDYSFRYLTVHKSKGLEEDNVIIINLENSMMGFPSKLEDDPILDLIIKNANIIPYEEERRLFYVALTRTKNINYLLVPNKNPSLFVKEIIRDYPDQIEIICIK